MTFARFVRIVRQRVRAAFRKDAVDAEASRELEFHVTQLTAEYQEAGMPPDEARRAARRAFGNLVAFEEQCRDERGLRWLHDLQQDCRYGLRLLRRTPGLTAVASGSLALGIGANAAIFALIDAALLKTLPFSDSDRLVIVRTIDRTNPQFSQNASLPDFLAWKERAGAFEGIEASLADQRDFAAGEDGAPAERVVGQLFTPGVFALLGVRPLAGRTLSDIDVEGQRTAPVLVISHRFWHRRFGADPNIVGRQVRVNGVYYTIVGVMPAHFRYPNERAEYWAPMQLEGRPPNATARYYMVVARLARGMTQDQAQADVDRLATRLAAERPDVHAGWDVRLVRVHDAFFAWTRAPLFTLLAAAALILLIACANVAGLLLARGYVRGPEIALRAALGAGRGRIVRQLIAESLLLSLLGATAGVAVTWWALYSLGSLAPPPGCAGIGTVGLELRLIAVMALAAIVTALIFGVGPALATSRLAPGEAFSPAQSIALRYGRVRDALVFVQIAVALMLLIASALLVNSFSRLAGRDLNFEPDGLLTFEFSIPGPQYARPLGTHAGFAYFEIGPGPSRTLERLYERLRGVPGAVSVAGISYSPVNSPIVPEVSLTLEGRPAPPGQPLPSAKYFLTTPDFFATIGAPIVRGRDIGSADTVSSPWVAVVNETMAARFWPGENPLGRRFRLDVVPEEVPREVIGVVRDIPTRQSWTSAEPVIYASYLQQPSRYRAPWLNMFGHMTFVLRAAGDPMVLVPAARHAAAEIDPNRPIYNIVALGPELRRQVRHRHSHVLVLGIFAAAATMLAAVGIYGVMMLSVARRTHEIGIRRMLGAGAREVIALVGRGAARVIGVGVLLGLAGSFALTRLIASQLWGITPTDPATFAGVLLLVLLVASAACLVPVRRALKVDPAVALKYE